MDKRAIQKEKTYHKILSITRDIYLDQGYLNTSTKSISKKAKVSQGTIFLHFKTKEKLLKEIVVRELNQVVTSLQIDHPSIENLFSSLVDHERLLSRVMKDYPYLPKNHQSAFEQVRMVYKDQLFELLQPKSKLSILDLFSLIEMVLALIFEDLFYASEPMMKQKVKKYHKIVKKYA